MQHLIKYWALFVLHVSFPKLLKYEILYQEIYTYLQHKKVLSTDIICLVCLGVEYKLN